MNGLIFIGIQASGKSSFYKENFSDTHMRINLDMLRTRNREKILFNACLQAKQPLVIDNTNPQIEDRKGYIESLKNNRFTVKGYYFESDISDCLKRNRQRDLPKAIPDVGVKATYKRLEQPSFDEGFDELYFVKMKNGEFVVEELVNEIQ